VKRLLLALSLIAVPTIAAAAPPHIGAQHTFTDPMFEGTVFCDTYDQVRAIATAAHPQDVFLTYLQLTNGKAEPTCATLNATGVVVDVKPLGVMEEDGFHFNAYSVEAQFGDVTAFALYLERFDMVQI
jgi:hypothetical protein